MLARSWTVDRFWREALKNAGLDLGGQIIGHDKYDLIHSVVESVSDAVYGLVSNAYMTAITVVPSAAGIIDLSTIRLKRGFEHKIILESTVGGSSATGALVGSVSVIAGDNVVTFTPALTSTNYLVFARIYDGAGSIGFNQNITKTTTGFTVAEVTAPGTMEYFVFQLTGSESANVQAVIAGGQTVAFPTALSGAGYALLWRVYDSSGASIGATISSRTAVGFDINCIDAGTIEYYAILTSGSFPLGLIKNAFSVAVPPASGVTVTLSNVMVDSSYVILMPWFYDSGGASLPYAISVKTVVGFTVTNIDVVSGTFEGIALDVASEIVGGSGDSAVRIYEGVSVEAVRMFQLHSDSIFHKKRLVFAYNGEELILGRGDFFAAWGSTTLRFPRIPTEATSDATYVDLPDGVAIQLGLLALETTLRKRYNAALNGQADHAQKMLKAAYDSSATTITAEEIKRKVEAIL